MDLLTSKMKSMYFKYLTAAFGSALISSIYGVVDMAMVVSVSRGAVASGILICILPVVVGVYAIWFAMPITEL